eukprot:scaffold824_cov327-Pavlova_lutheri.AAC.22
MAKPQYPDGPQTYQLRLPGQSRYFPLFTAQGGIFLAGGLPPAEANLHPSLLGKKKLFGGRALEISQGPYGQSSLYGPPIVLPFRGTILSDPFRDPHPDPDMVDRDH